MQIKEIYNINNGKCLYTEVVQKALIKEIARIAVERGCGRLELSCLD